MVVAEDVATAAAVVAAIEGGEGLCAGGRVAESRGGVWLKGG